MTALTGYKEWKAGMIRFLAVLCLVLGTVLLAPVSIASASITSCPVLIAHQGYSGAANGHGPIPNNSIAALDNAVRHGARAVEFDVRWSRDNVPIVIHNSTVNATTRHSGLVAHYRASTLERMHLVSPRHSDHVAADTIPSMAEMIDAARSKNVRVVIEIKAARISAAKAASFASAIDSYSAVSIHSFYLSSLDVLPDYPHSLLTETPLTTIPAGIAGVDMRGSIVTAARVAALHSSGLVAGAFTTSGSGVSDNSAEWSKLAADGVNRIITNNTAGYVSWKNRHC